jgi:hypothetical protein
MRIIAIGECPKLDAKGFCPQALRDGRFSLSEQDRSQGVCPKCGASGPKRESQQEALLSQKIFFLVLLRANRTSKKTADSELRQTITTIMVLAAFPLATETQARLEENQPSREAEPVTNATPEPTPFVENETIRD